MATKGGQPGNRNAATSADKAPFKSALNRLLVQEDYKRIHESANQVLELASRGERWAVELLRDTTDGKPAQESTVNHSGNLNVFTWQK